MSYAAVLRCWSGPVVEANGSMIMVDGRPACPMEEGDNPRKMKMWLPVPVECYPRDRIAVDHCSTLPGNYSRKLLLTPYFRNDQGRVIDHDQAGSMGKREQTSGLFYFQLKRRRLAPGEDNESTIRFDQTKIFCLPGPKATSQSARTARFLTCGNVDDWQEHADRAFAA